jgi:hypothetical protein
MAVGELRGVAGLEPTMELQGELRLFCCRNSLVSSDDSSCFCYLSWVVLTLD